MGFRVWGYIEIMESENYHGTLGLYIWIMENNMEATIVYGSFYLAPQGSWVQSLGLLECPCFAENSFLRYMLTRNTGYIPQPQTLNAIDSSMSGIRSCGTDV